MNNLSEEEQQKINQQIATYLGWEHKIKLDDGYSFYRVGESINYQSTKYMHTDWNIIIPCWSKVLDELRNTKTVEGGKLEYFTFHFAACVNKDDCQGATQLLSSAISYLKTHTIKIHE